MKQSSNVPLQLSLGAAANIAATAARLSHFATCPAVLPPKNNIVYLSIATQTQLYHRPVLSLTFGWTLRSCSTLLATAQNLHQLHSTCAIDAPQHLQELLDSQPATCLTRLVCCEPAHAQQCSSYTNYTTLLLRTCARTYYCILSSCWLDIKARLKQSATRTPLNRV